MPFRKILVPVDFSPSSRAALAEALELAEALGASVHVLHVAARAADIDTERHLGELLSEVGDRLPGRLTHSIEHGEVVPRLLDHARREGVDLIAMGTHGRMGRLHMLVGSVAHGVVRNANCPVLTVRVSDGSEESLKDRLRGGARIG